MKKLLTIAAFALLVSCNDDGPKREPNYGYVELSEATLPLKVLAVATARNENVGYNGTKYHVDSRTTLVLSDTRGYIYRIFLNGETTTKVGDVFTAAEQIGR